MKIWIVEYSDCGFFAVLSFNRTLEGAEAAMVRWTAVANGNRFYQANNLSISEQELEE